MAQWQRIHLSVQETQETGVRSPAQEDPLEEEMAACCGILAWEISWTEAGCSPWGHKESRMTEYLSTQVCAYVMRSQQRRSVLGGISLDVSVTFKFLCLKHGLWLGGSFPDAGRD